MITLFEIPIYSISPKTLEKHYRLLLQDVEVNCNSRNVPKEHAIAVAEYETYPYRLWQYNHISGFIKITTDKNDVFYDIFLPVGQRERFRWRSRRKVFLYNTSTVGFHFRVAEAKSNVEIQDQLQRWLSAAEKQVHKCYSNFYVDKSCFENTYLHIDYLSIIKEANQNGQAENGDGGQSR